MDGVVSRRFIAVIPARGGSKRIPKKNIVDFHGRPMIGWTIEAAQRTGRFSNIIVSTDDLEIAAVAEKFGAAVPFLRARHADDVAPVSLATLEALAQVKEHLHEEYDVVVQLMANCPLRNEEHIEAALDSFHRRDASSQLSCFKFGWMNPWWAVTLADDGRPTPLFPDAYSSGSQHLPPLYCPSGAIWIAKVPHLLEHRTFHSPDRTFWPMSWQAAMDIDDHDDLRMAELLYTMQDRKK
jgi:CMP-N-acetylneuraminic acid synthetase